MTDKTQAPDPAPLQQPSGALPDDSLAQQADAWRAVCRTLHEVAPGWLDPKGTGQELAVATIRRLAAIPAPEGAQAAVMRQALAALDAVMVGSTLHDDGDGWGTIAMPKPEAMTLALAAAAALRAALAAPRVTEGADAAWLAWVSKRADMLRTLHNENIFKAGYSAALAAPAPQADEQRSMFCPVCEARGRTDAAPAPQAPVPMTDAEIGDLYVRWKDCDGASFADLMRAVERHHGITQTKEPKA